MGDEDYKKSSSERSSRVVAIGGVALSTVAITACLIAFPMVFNYILRLQAGIQQNVQFCRSRSRDMWKETIGIQQHKETSPERLAKAMNLLRDVDPQVAQSFGPLPSRQVRQASGGCCTCHRGGVGPAGDPGVDGRDGNAGDNGDNGANGPPASPEKIAAQSQSLCPCEAGPAGDQGGAGPKGPPGPSGNPGPAGEDGQGTPGVAGDQGPVGPSGKAGPKGPNGDDGGVVAGSGGPAGPPGAPGPDGSAGPAGNAGPAGKPGNDGTPGGPGEKGPNGNNGSKGKDGNPGPRGPAGAPGSCATCPVPRTSPGY